MVSAFNFCPPVRDSLVKIWASRQVYSIHNSIIVFDFIFFTCCDPLPQSRCSWPGKVQVAMTHATELDNSRIFVIDGVRTVCLFRGLAASAELLHATNFITWLSTASIVILSWDSTNALNSIFVIKSAWGDAWMFWTNLSRAVPEPGWYRYGSWTSRFSRPRCC